MKEKVIFNPDKFIFTSGFRKSIKIENEREPLYGIPIDGFDEQRNLPYLLFPDGRKIYETENDQ